MSSFEIVMLADFRRNFDFVWRNQNEEEEKLLFGNISNPNYNLKIDIERLQFLNEDLSPDAELDG